MNTLLIDSRQLESGDALVSLQGYLCHKFTTPDTRGRILLRNPPSSRQTSGSPTSFPLS